MPQVVRKGSDSHIGHASPTPNPFHKTSYSASGQNPIKVYAMGDAVVLGAGQGGTSCGDPAMGMSSKVFVQGIGVHRKGDATGGHGSWVPNSAATGAPKVYADGD